MTSVRSRPPGQPVACRCGDHIRGPRPTMYARSGAACRGFGSGGMGGASENPLESKNCNGVVSEDASCSGHRTAGATPRTGRTWEILALGTGDVARVSLGSWQDCQPGPRANTTGLDRNQRCVAALAAACACLQGCTSPRPRNISSACPTCCLKRANAAGPFTAKNGVTTP